MSLEIAIGGYNNRMVAGAASLAQETSLILVDIHVYQT
jgi:hypothetical protein